MGIKTFSHDFLGLSEVALKNLPTTWGLKRMMHLGIQSCVRL